MLNPRLLLLSTALVTTVSALPPVTIRGTAESTWTENLSRSSSRVDWTDALTARAQLAASVQYQLAPNLTGTASVQGDLSTAPKFDDLTRFDFGPHAGLRKKFGLGLFAPVVAADVGVDGRIAKIDGDSGWTPTASLSFTQRLLENVSLTGTGDWHEHYAKGATFDNMYQRLYAEIAWDVTDRWRVAFGRGRLWGEFTANASPTIWARALAGGLGPAIANYYNTVPREQTDIFGPGWTTYRVDGHVNFWWFAVTPALTENTSLSFRYDRVLAQNIVNVRYRQGIFSLQLLHQF